MNIKKKWSLDCEERTFIKCKKMFQNRIIVFVIIIIIVPTIVALLMEFSLFWKVKTDNDWIGFFGSYIGSVVGVIGVFMVMKMDQQKRDEERNSELFLNNLSIYREISSLLGVEKLDELKEKLAKIRIHDNWKMVDSFTGVKLKRIESNLHCSDEKQGLFGAVSNFIMKNLFDELKVTLENPASEFIEPFEYEEVPFEVLYAMSNIIVNKSEIDLVYENSIRLQASKDELFELLEENQCTKGYGEKREAIYTKLLQIQESKEWSDYIYRRTATFKQAYNLKEQIDNRIEEVLDYWVR